MKTATRFQTYFEGNQYPVYQDGKAYFIVIGKKRTGRDKVWYVDFEDLF